MVGTELASAAETVAEVEAGVEVVVGVEVVAVVVVLVTWGEKGSSSISLWARISSTNVE